MTLATRIMLAGGICRYGGAGTTILLGAIVNPVLYIAGGVWLIGCRPVLRHFLLPPLFPATTCPCCRERISLYARWKDEHFTDRKIRHVLSVHCHKGGHEVGYFDCPTCGTTIQIQKGNRKIFQRWKIVESTPVRQPQTANWLYWFRRKTEDGIMIGYDRRYVPSRFGQRFRKLFRFSTEKSITVFDSALACHWYLLGATGMGKSTLILNAAAQLFKRGEGATFIDPAGDLSKKLLRLVPPERANDVLYFNVRDRDFPFPFNLLHARNDVERNNLIDELIDIIHRLSTHWGDKIERQLRMALKTVLQIDGSLQDVYDLFTNARKRARIVAKIKDEELVEYWTETFPSMRYEARVAVITKIVPIVDHPLLGPILCARKNLFDADSVIRDRKIVIINLYTGSPADTVPHLAGTFVVNKLLPAAYRQGDLPEEKRIRHFFFIDEFQRFMHRSNRFEDILSEVRKFRLVLVCANQFVTQLSKEVRDALFGNAGCLTIFRVGSPDAKVLKEEFSGGARDLTGLDKYECAVRIGNHHLSVRTPPPPKPAHADQTEFIVKRNHELIQNTRQRYPSNESESPRHVPKEVATATQYDEQVLCEFA